MLGSLRSKSTATNSWDPDDVPWLVVGLACIAALLVGLGFMLDYSALDVWTAMIVFLVLTGASVPVFHWIARREGDPWLSKVLLAGLLVKFVGSMARYFMIMVMYGGSGDAGRYHEAGVTFVNRLRDGDPIHPIEIMKGFPPETQRIADFVGGLYTVTGPSAYAGFLLFAFICFWGQVLIIRGFKVAVPEGDHRRFALLVLFLPSLVFWPSSIGKEALMIGCLGVIIYGGALLLAPRPQIRGAIYFVAGSLLVLLFRPHVAAMAIGALAIAMAVGLLGGFQGGAPRKQTGRGRAVRFVALAAVLVLAVTASTRLGETFDDSESESGALSSLEDTASQTSRGGSEFAPMVINGPTRLPAGLVTVFFRPFPWEAGNLNGIIAGAEGLLLAGLFAVSWRRVLSFPRMALRRPFLVFSTTYVVLFGIGFSFIANFGILARQRVQALVVLLMVLALPKAPMPSLSFRRKNNQDDRDPGPTEADMQGPERAAGELVGVVERRYHGSSAPTPASVDGGDGPSGPFKEGSIPSRGSSGVAGRLGSVGERVSGVDQ